MCLFEQWCMGYGKEDSFFETDKLFWKNLGKKKNAEKSRN